MGKNEVAIKVEDFGADGEAVGRLDGKAVFVRPRCDIALGDKILARILEDKRNFFSAEFAGFVEKTESRQEGFCDETLCGGCPLAATSAEAQIDFKTKKIRRALQSIGGFSSAQTDEILLPLIPCKNAEHCRNKVRFAVRSKKAQTGFFAAHSNQFVSVESCKVAPEGSDEVLRAVRGYLRETGGAKISSLIVRRSAMTGALTVCAVSPQRVLPNEKGLVNSLSSAAKLDGAMLFSDANFPQLSGGRVLFGENAFCESLSVGGETLAFRVSAQSFFQVNREQTQRLYEAALSFADLQKNHVALDLFCGVGTISLFAAKKAKKVFGVEISAKSISDAVESAKMNGIENAEFFAVSAEKISEQILREKIDVIFADPPRNGCGKNVLKKILEIRPKKIVYVSCDAATFSRDAKFLCAGGYALQKVQPVDQFPQTVHTETAALFCNSLEGRQPLFLQNLLTFFLLLCRMGRFAAIVYRYYTTFPRLIGRFDSA